MKIIRSFLLLTIDHVATDIDLPIRDFSLHRNIDDILPTTGINGKSDIIELYGLFGHLFFVEDHWVDLLL